MEERRFWGFDTSFLNDQYVLTKALDTQLFSRWCLLFFFSERVNNNTLFTPNGERRKEKKLWANIAQSVILIVIYLKDRSYNLALVSQVLYHTLRRNHLGISYQSFPHSLHRHSKTLLNSKIRDTVWVAQESSSRYARRTNAKQKRGFKINWNNVVGEGSFFLAIKRLLIQMRGGTIIMQNYTIPGGHDMHPSEPWEEELENVPTGHGRKNQKSSFCSGVRVNPDASRAEIQTFPFSDLGRGTAIDSVSDKYGFLKRMLQEKKRKNQDSKSCESFCSKPF